MGCGENRRTIRKGRGEGLWKILDRKLREKYKLLRVGKVENERECQKIEKKKLWLEFVKGKCQKEGRKHKFIKRKGR